jgi:uncharacterized membrane protein YheB (UPF0754 family)
LRVPSKTNQDRILDLEREVAKLIERVDNVRRDIARIEKALEERTNRRWTLMLALVGVLGGLIGSILPNLVNAALTYFRR